MKRSAVSPEEWLRHRKYRKKIASAKWYAHKKQREIEEEHTHRRRIEEELREKERQRQGYVWPEHRHRNEWAAVVAHLCRGYPVRPDHQCATQWRTWCDEIEAEIGHLRENVERYFPECRVWMHETFVCKIFRQMGIREKQQPTTFQYTQVPWGCTHPHHRGRLWVTSAWNWVWVMTHLGNHAEHFSVVWSHIHQWALSHPLHRGDEWTLLAHTPTLRHWLHWMSQDLHTHFEAILEPYTDDDTEDEPSDTHSNPPPLPYDGYVTQPDTPNWEDIYSTDSESDSVPSSLDTFVNETFAIPDPECPP